MLPQRAVFGHRSSTEIPEPSKVGVKEVSGRSAYSALEFNVRRIRRQRSSFARHAGSRNAPRSLQNSLESFLAMDVSLRTKCKYASIVKRNKCTNSISATP